MGVAGMTIKYLSYIMAISAVNFIAINMHLYFTCLCKRWSLKTRLKFNEGLHLKFGVTGVALPIDVSKITL